MLATITIVAALFGLPLTQTPATNSAAVYLSDHDDLLMHSRQTWGELGLNENAHQPGQKGLPLQIGDKKYEKGLGHHASGEIYIELDGQYDTFAAEVGVQVAPGVGTVVFKVLVDDQIKFDSGVMKTGEPAKSVSVPVAGAGELRLVAEDAGDGIACDCATWAEARLIKSAAPKPAAAPRRLEAAQFARIVTSDPNRMDGCKASRIEEYRAEDVYLETDLPPDASGAYTAPFTNDGPGAIGLRWLERRVLLELGIEFAAGAPTSTDGVQIQYWTGESAWQGRWQLLKTAIKVDGDRWLARLDWRIAPDLTIGTRRIRWILPAAAKGAKMKGLTALSITPLAEVRLHIECDPKVLGDSAAGMAPAEIALYNGEFVNPVGRGRPPVLRWNYRAGEPLTLTVLAAKSRAVKTDRAILQFRLPGGRAFGVAVEDVQNTGQVYVKSAGVYVTLAPAAATLEQYRKQIAERKTILEEVRHMPDQTLAQALEHVHNPAQNRQPTMLSLACDNHKFIAYRDGVIIFAADQAKPGTAEAWLSGKELAVFRPKFGTGKNEGLKRHLEDGWLPMSVNEVSEDGLVYRQRTYVAPLEELPLPEPGWLSPHPLCVAELSIENAKSQAAPAALGLSFALPDNPAGFALRSEGARVLVSNADRLLGCVDLGDAPALKAEIRGGELALTGEVPAGQTARLTLYLPGWVLASKDHAQLAGGTKLADRCKAYWEHVMAPAAKITVPDPLLMNAVKASQAHCFLVARSEADGQRVAPWIAADLYGPLESEAMSIVRGMDFLGHHEFARRGHDYFIHRYKPAGFLTTGYTLMGTGWQVWSAGEHYSLARDSDWLKKIAPELGRVCKWIMAQREKTKQLGPDGQKQPEYGLMPPGVIADWNAFAYHFCLNAYYYAALKSAAAALADIDYPDTKTWLDNAAEFKDDIMRAYRWTQARMPAHLLRDGTAVPGCPSQVHSPGPVVDFFPGEDANRSWCYDVEIGAHQLVPLGVLDENAPEATWTMNYYEDVEFLADGWFDFASPRNHADWYNLGGFAKVQPYYCRNCEVYALRDDVKPFIRSYFNTISTELSLENLAFQEHFAGAGAWNKTHETGYFLHQSRIMLVLEKKKELWLAPCITCNWFKDGQVVGIENAPTKFGTASFKITSHAAAGTIEATIEPPTRSAPETIVLRLRHPEGKPMKSVAVNGQPHGNFDPGKEIVRITPGKDKITVVASY